MPILEILQCLSLGYWSAPAAVRNRSSPSAKGVIENVCAIRLD
jgi:hypothetical protein